MSSQESENIYSTIERHLIRVVVLMMLIFAALELIAGEVPTWLVGWLMSLT